MTLNVHLVIAYVAYTGDVICTENSSSPEDFCHNNLFGEETRKRNPKSGDLIYN